ncbi:MAG: hypothetical protein OXC53_08285, partial [Rhodobacteraceae bacterium]|nr:hypothetical protein [Paracoccaceae bacterium]
SALSQTVSQARLTDTSEMPGAAETVCSTRPTQLAHDIPETGIETCTMCAAYHESGNTDIA